MNDERITILDAVAMCYSNGITIYAESLRKRLRDAGIAYDDLDGKYKYSKKEVAAWIESLCEITNDAKYVPLVMLAKTETERAMLYARVRRGKIVYNVVRSKKDGGRKIICLEKDGATKILEKHRAKYNGSKK